MSKRKSEQPSREERSKRMRFINLMAGKKVLGDSSKLLQEVFIELTEPGNAQDFDELPAKILLLLKGIEKATNLLDYVFRLDKNLRLGKDLISHARSTENSRLAVQNCLDQYFEKSLAQQRLENGTEDVVLPPPSSAKKKKKPSQEELQKIVEDLEKYEAPGVDGSRYCMRQLITLLKIDCSSPIYQKQVSKTVAALKAAGKCDVNYNTLRRQIAKYNHEQILPREGNEGKSLGRPPLLPPH